MALGPHSLSDPCPLFIFFLFFLQLSYAAGRAVRMALLRADLWLEEAGVLGAPRPPAPTGPAGAPADAHSMHLTPEQQEVLDRVQRLTLDDHRVAAREKAREASGNGVAAAWPVRIVYGSLCFITDVIYAGRPIQRFWFLETVARMPYFAFISMLHLYESLGWWRAGAELRKVCCVGGRVGEVCRCGWVRLGHPPRAGRRCGGPATARPLT